MRHSPSSCIRHIGLRRQVFIVSVAMLWPTLHMVVAMSLTVVVVGHCVPRGFAIVKRLRQKYCADWSPCWSTTLGSRACRQAKDTLYDRKKQRLCIPGNRECWCWIWIVWDPVYFGGYFRILLTSTMRGPTHINNQGNLDKDTQETIKWLWCNIRKFPWCPSSKFEPRCDVWPS